MKRIFFSFFLTGSALLAFLSGSGHLKAFVDRPAFSYSPLKHLHPEREHPVQQQKPIALLVYSYNQASWCQRALQSIFEQDYEAYRVILVDDGSTDRTFELAQRFIIENEQAHRVITMRNDTHLGPVGSLYRAAEHCLDSEIIFPIDAKDWFVSEGVLLRLNQLFHNPDTWVVLGQEISYPTFEIVDPPSWSEEEVKTQGFCSLKHPCKAFACYASLFKSIPLQNLLFQGRFSSLLQTYVSILLEKCGGRMQVVKEPFLFVNQASPSRVSSDFQKDIFTLFRPPYSPLQQLPITLFSPIEIDLLISSSDCPLQLYSCLESIDRYLSGFDSITVWIHASDERFSRAYEEIQSAFPHVCYLRDLADFSSNGYVLKGRDDAVFRDFVDLHSCAEILHKTKASRFHLRWGNGLSDAPKGLSLNNGIVAVEGISDENGDMVLYKTGSEASSIQLYFEEAKTIHFPSSTPFKEEYLKKFQEGWKIDVEPFFQLEHISSVFHDVPQFIPR